MHIQAHRGASSESAENSLESVVRAIEIGVDSIELDIQLLRDERFLVIHDFQIGSALIAELFSSDSRIQDHPLLEDIVGALPGRLLKKDFFLDLEIKRDPYSSSSYSPDQIANIFIETIERLQPVSPIVVRSFDWDVLRQIKKYKSKQLVTPLIKPDFSSLDEAIQLSSDWIAVPKETLSLRRIEQIQAANKKVMVYTVNSFAEWKKWIQAGVEGITTDNPRELLNMLNGSFFE